MRAWCLQDIRSRGLRHYRLRWRNHPHTHVHVHFYACRCMQHSPTAAGQEWMEALLELRDFSEGEIPKCVRLAGLVHDMGVGSRHRCGRVHCPGF